MRALGGAAGGLRAAEGGGGCDDHHPRLLRHPGGAAGVRRVHVARVCRHCYAEAGAALRLHCRSTSVVDGKGLQQANETALQLLFVMQAPV